MTNTPGVDAAGSSVVWALAYTTYNDGTVGGTCSPVYINVGGRSVDQVRVGFFESEVFGTGNQWRSAGWTAALMAAQLSDFDPRCMQVSFDYEGRIDGPSAGGLMTVGVLAAVRGDKIREDAAMTGTINPDGTIGPVGGIPYKIEGAAAQGKKLVLIPAGIRIQTKDDGKEFDLIAHGKELGVEVRPVVDIRSAYKLLTGVDLPQAPPADEPKTSSIIAEMIRTKTSDWIDLFKTALDDYKQRPEFARPQQVADIYDKGMALLQNVPKLQNEGEFGVAYWDAVEGAAYAYLATEVAKSLHMVQLRGRRGMVDRIRDNGWLEDEVRAKAERLRNETPQSLDQMSMYLTACSAFFEAISLQYVAQQTLAAIPSEPTEANDDQAVLASGHQIVAYLDLHLVGDMLDLMAKCHGPPIPGDAPIRKVAEYYNRAGEANMAVFDSLVTQDASENWQLSMDETKHKLQTKDEDYAIMYGAQHIVTTSLSKHFGQGEAYAFGRLAAGLFMYPRSAGLIAKYYSLGAELDKSFQVVSLRRERTFSDWLDGLEDRTRRSIGFLQARGMHVSLCAEQYEISHVRRSRDLQSRLRALNDLLFTYTQAECIRRLAGYSLTDAQP